jgi:hypothetical protein
MLCFSPSNDDAGSSSQAGAPAKASQPSFFKRALGEQSGALDGAIPGAVSGILVGVLGVAAVGVLSGEAAGEVLAAVFWGFMLGFALGSLLGGMLGIVARRLRPDFRVKPGFMQIVAGGLVGCLVMLVFENLRWLPVGAVVGAIGSNLWALICNRVESDSAPRSRFTLEDHFPLEEAEETSRRFS